MKTKYAWTILLPILLLSVTTVRSAPTVTLQTYFTGGFWSLDYRVLDFYYTPSPGAEFTNYNINVTSSGGAKILDPIRGVDGWFKQANNTLDTWVTTPTTSLYGAAPSAVIQAYKPTMPNASPIPTDHLQWEVFDTETGDGNAINTGDPVTFPPDGIVHAPYHVARILVDPICNCQARVDALDTLSNGVPTVYYFITNPLTFPPVGGRSTIDAIPGDSIDYLFKAIVPGAPDTPITWSNFTFSGPGAVNQPLFDYNTHQFNWNSAGSPLGTYIASVNLHTFGNGTATLTINLVPEPTTLALLGFAFPALTAGRRRKQ